MNDKRSIPKPLLLWWKRLRHDSIFGWGFSYEFGLKVQRSLLSIPGAPTLFFARHMAVVREWIKICSIPNPDDAILLSLMINTWQGWRVASLRKPEVAEKWVRYEGLEHLHQALERKRGVIFLSLHTVNAGVISRAIRQVTDQEIHILGGRVDGLNETMMMATYVRRVIEAQKRLQEGAIIGFAGDGLRGKISVPAPFYGRAFPFRSGFADLAVRNNAVLVAAFVYYELDGRVTVEFSKPFEAGQGTHEEQVNELVREYAGIIIERWPRLIPSLKWRKLRQILEMPPVSE